jgi:CheY-like chemotaxis protein
MLDAVRLRILIVDDMVDDTAMLAMLLRRAVPDCEVETRNDPRQCLDLAEQFEPHLILLDVAMPGMSGFEVARELRKLDIPPFLLVARTGFAEASMREKCLANDFNFVLPKPGLDELLQLMDVARKFAEV